MKTIKVKNLVGLSLSLIALFSVEQSFSTTVKIEQAGITVLDAAGTTLSSNLGVKAGYWASGFTPTLDNITNWDENFISINGSWASATKKYSVVFTMNDNQVVGGTQTAASATGVTIAAGTQLYLIGSTSAYNSANNTSSAGFNSYIGAATNTPVFILADTSWIMRSGTATTDPTTYTLGFTTNTQLAVFGGTTFGKAFSFDSVAGTGSLQMIPEPSTVSLFGLGALALLSRRRAKKNSLTRIVGRYSSLMGSLLVILGISAMCVSAQTVSTPVVGFQKKTIQGVGYTPVGLPLVKSATITTTVSSKSGYNITLATALGTVDATKQYYLEVVSGTLAGERADVSISSSSAMVTILSSPRNSSSLEGLSNGDKVCIRSHLVLRDLVDSISPALVGNDDASLCDRVLLYNNGFIGYNKDSTGAWIQDGELDDVTDTLVIAPGTGVLIQRRSSTPTTLTAIGEVRANKFARPFAQGYQLIAPAYPVGLSPNSIAADSASNWGSSDKILPFNSGFVEYNFDPLDTSGGANGTWYETGQLDPVNSLTLISFDGIGFVYRNASDVGIVETSPVQ